MPFSALIHEERASLHLSPLGAFSRYVLWVNRRGVPRWLTAMGLGYMAWRSVGVFSDLPTSMASHYDAGGRPDAFTERGDFFVFYWLVTGLVVLSLVGSAELTKRIPGKFLNLPHKPYWTTEERLPIARSKVDEALWWMCAASTLLLAAILELVIQSNIARVPMSSTGMWAILIAYFTFTTVWTIQLVRSFIPPDHTEA